MKRKLYYPVAAILFSGLLYVGCSKNLDTPGSGVSASGITTTDAVIVQNAESQEAVNDKVEQSIDNTSDAVESNKFTGTTLKSGSIGYSLAIDHPTTDTAKITFPKVVTIVYNNSDTINGEHTSMTGTVIITVDTIPVGTKSYWRNHVKRTIQFQNLTVTTDSSKFVFNGTRVMYRLSSKVKQSSDLKLRAEAIDSISSNYTLNVTSGTTSKTVTRIAHKTRDAIAHFVRATTTSRWTSDIKSDTIKITGAVTGVNSNGVSYSRVITTPIVIVFKQSWPYNQVIASGVITYTVGTSTPFIITYTGLDGFNTNVSISRDGKVKLFQRRCGRKMGSGMF
ncbi:MAG: hypothetical protein Q8928_15210 [Bacteroidota bacterium]|nr:hypothetical protein [Bacteroidota bacterium]